MNAVLTQLQLRSSAAVIFRRVACKPRKVPNSNDNKELFLSLSNEAKVPIRTLLLQCLSNESVPHVRNKVGDAIAEVARQYADAGEAWPELLSALFQCSQSPDSTVREVSFRILATTPGIIERQHENIVQEVFGKGFRDDSVNVRII